MTIPGKESEARYFLSTRLLAASVLVLSGSASRGAETASEPFPLVERNGSVPESVLEGFLSPGEFAHRRYEYVIGGEEATFILDSSLSAERPHAEIHPGRVRWPDIAGLELKAGEQPLELAPFSKTVSDDALDKGFVVRFVLKAMGQSFDPSPHFAADVMEAEVLSLEGKDRLLFWNRAAPPPICAHKPSKSRPNCALDSVGLEARAISVSPSGKLLALAFGGLIPRMEIYDIEKTPRLLWRSLFSKASGGVVEVAFAWDEKWVAALTGQGRMHRFDASTGGRHLSIPSSGRTARAITEKHIMGVAAGAGEVRFYYLDDGTIAWQLPPRKNRGPVDRLAVSGDGLRFATLEYNDKITMLRVWEWRNRSMVAQFETEPYAVHDLALDERGDTLFYSHEEDGLFYAKVKKEGAPRRLGGKQASRCRGHLKWISGDKTLSCSVKGGEIRIDAEGRLRGELVADDAGEDWLMSAASSGTRMAAVGGGRLLIWWTN